MLRIVFRIYIAPCLHGEYRYPIGVPRNLLRIIPDDFHAQRFRRGCGWRLTLVQGREGSQDVGEEVAGGGEEGAVGTAAPDGVDMSFDGEVTQAGEDVRVDDAGGELVEGWGGVFAEFVVIVFGPEEGTSFVLGALYIK